MVVIAYLSIPKDAAPFMLDAKYFYPSLILCLILIGVLTQLLFIVFSTRPAWSKKVSAWMQKRCPDFGKLRNVCRNVWVRDRPTETGNMAGDV